MKLRISIRAAMIWAGSALLWTSGLLMSDARAAADDANKACSNASLRGSFGFYRTGSTSAGPLAALGTIVFDGEGNIVGRSQSISRNGAFTFDVPIGGGTYLIDADCTGKGWDKTGVEAFRIVLVDGGKGFYIFSESPGNAVYGAGRRISVPDDD